MSAEVKPFATIEDIIAADGDSKYATVDAYGVTVRLKSLSSAEMIAWIESQHDKDKAKFAGLYLAVLSLAGPNGERVPEHAIDETVNVFKGKHAGSNRAVIRAAREINGLDNIVATNDALKNDSGEANTDASPTDSASN